MNFLCKQRPFGKSYTDNPSVLQFLKCVSVELLARDETAQHNQTQMKRVLMNNNQQLNFLHQTSSMISWLQKSIFLHSFQVLLMTSLNGNIFTSSYTVYCHKKTSWAISGERPSFRSNMCVQMVLSANRLLEQNEQEIGC